MGAPSLLNYPFATSTFDFLGACRDLLFVSIKFFIFLKDISSFLYLSHSMRRSGVFFFLKEATSMLGFLGSCWDLFSLLIRFCIFLKEISSSVLFVSLNEMKCFCF